jgi:hypothetical protein
LVDLALPLRKSGNTANHSHCITAVLHYITEERTGMRSPQRWLASAVHSTIQQGGNIVFLSSIEKYGVGRLGHSVALATLHLGRTYLAVLHAGAKIFYFAATCFWCWVVFDITWRRHIELATNKTAESITWRTDLLKIDAAAGKTPCILASGKQ